MTICPVVEIDIVLFTPRGLDNTTWPVFHGPDTIDPDVFMIVTTASRLGRVNKACTDRYAPEQLVEPNESIPQKLVTVTPFRKATFSTHSSDPEQATPPSYNPLLFVSVKIMAKEGLAVLKKTPYEEPNCPDPTDFSLTVVP